MKLKIKKLSYLLLISIFFTSIAPISAHASEVQSRQWGEIRCPGENTCYGCDAPNCMVYKVQNLTVRFSYDECKRIATRGSTISDFSSYASIVVGIKSVVVGSWLGLYSMAVSKNIEMFKTAVAKDSGLELKSEFVINKISNSLSIHRKASKKYIPSTVSYSRVLKVTNPLMYGSDVKKVQSKLNSLGYNAGTADGYYGNNTKNAVIKFQKAKNISADGIVGPTTWNKLF